MASSGLNRIKPSYRAPVPLPPPPSLSNLLQHSVATKEDVARFDRALADWWQRFQVAFSLNVQAQRPIDCGVAGLGVTKIQLRRGTAVDWTDVNPLLAEGEIGIETDTRKAKIGDGVTVWRDLPYAFLT